LNVHLVGHTQVKPGFCRHLSKERTWTEGGGEVTRLQMAGRWAQVVGAVLAWILFVPVFELVRSVAERLGLVGRKDTPAQLGRAVGSRTPAAHAHRRRAA
jgi:hypothetical protein